MVSDLRDAFHNLLNENEWMDDSTRQAAAQKADAMLVLLGFPSWCESSAELDDFYKDVSGRLGSEERFKSHPTSTLSVLFASIKSVNIRSDANFSALYVFSAVLISLRNSDF